MRDEVLSCVAELYPLESERMKWVRNLVDTEDTQKSKNVRILMDGYGLDRQGIENVFQIREKHGKNKQKPKTRNQTL